MSRNEELIGVWNGADYVFDNGDDRRCVIGTLRLMNRERTTLRGYAAEHELVAGVTYRFYGHFRNHPKHGRQFAFNSFVEEAPVDEDSVLAYLTQCRKPERGSITDRVARALFEEFGLESISKLIADPVGAAANVKQWGAEKAAIASEYLRTQEGTRNCKLALIGILDGRGFPKKTVDRAIKEWGAAAAKVVKTDPYELMKLPGIGFKGADKLYCDLAREAAKTDEEYQQALGAMKRQGLCVAYYVNTESRQSGDTWVSIGMAKAAVSRLISSTHAKPNEAIEWAVLNGRLVVRDAFCANARMALHELEIAEFMTGSEEGNEWPDIELIRDMAPEGKPLSQHQLEAIQIATSQRVGCLQGSPGVGKAQPLDCKVLTPNGFVEMGSLSVGDEVIGKNGKPTKVIGVFPQGMKPVWKVTMSDDATTRCCDEHLWSTTTKNERRSKSVSFRTRPLSEIRETINRQDRPYDGQNHQIPMVDPVEFSQQSTLPIHPYVLGVFLGDGGMSQGSVTLSNPEEFIINEVSALIPDGMALKRYDEDRCDYRVVQKEFKHRGNAVLNSFRELGIMGKRSFEKTVPMEYLLADKKSRLLLLQGLLDTDGTVDRCNIEFCTTSTGLRDAVMFLAMSLGWVATSKSRVTWFTYKGVKKQGRVSYRVLVRPANGDLPFRLPRKLDAYIPRTKYLPSRRIKSVTPDGFAECQCIKVEAADGLYVTDDFIVTHNTFAVACIAKAVIRKYGEDSIGLAAPTGKAGVRMSQSLAANGVKVPASTIHRLLGVEGQEGDGWRFHYNDQNPLPFRFMVIDEMSMTDVDLLASLLRACTPSMHLLFIGDSNQLAPVGHGRPFYDLQSCIPTGHLTEIRRNSGKIVEACAEIRDRNTISFSPQINLPADNLTLISAADEQQVQVLEDVIGIIGNNDGDTIEDLQIVTGKNDGSEVARKPLNKMLQKLFNANGHCMHGNPFRVGDKIVCLKNGTYPDAEEQTDEHFVANGELGRVIEIHPGRMTVRLSDPIREIKIIHAPVQENERDVADSEDSQRGAVGDWDLGYALSVHRSQGSQWKYVIVMADSKGGMVQTRNWIYTAISRAEISTWVIGQRQVVNQMMRRDGISNRKTFLVERITEQRGLVAVDFNELFAEV